MCSKLKPTIPVCKNDPVASKPPVKVPTVARPSRLTKYAEAYAEKRKAMLERYKKEQEEKNKPKRFRARSLPKYIKAQKAQKGLIIEENKENVGSTMEVRQVSKLPDKRRNLRKSKSALEFN